jgi:GntR family transcriptional regulator
VKRHGSGTYVSDYGSPLARKERLKILSQRVDALLAEATHMQVPAEDLIKLIKDRHQSMQPQENK